MWPAITFGASGLLFIGIPMWMIFLLLAIVAMISQGVSMDVVVQGLTAVLNEQAARELQRGGAVVDGKPSPWIVVQEKCIRALVSLSMRLRLSPQSRLDPKTVAPQQQFQGPPPWQREDP